jgi:hypothetical protein
MMKRPAERRAFLFLDVGQTARFIRSYKQKV